MGTSTVSGPFRSENGFQELVNGVWTPVSGGGGGGGGLVPVALVSQYGPALGLSDNRYSDNSSGSPSGPSAGTIIQLPPISVGGTYYIYAPVGGSSFDAWALKLPTVPGADLSAFASGKFAINYGTTTDGSYPVFTIGPESFAYTNLSSPTDILYVYGGISETSWLGITLGGILPISGFGTVAFFTQSNTPVMNNYNPFPDPYFYPYTQLIGS